ncbi:MAG: PIN domain-containing protein [Thermoplasmatota archaeon]
MKLVIDSNRVMAGLIKNSSTRMIILNEEIDFVAPEYLLVEIEKYKEYPMKKSHQSEREFQVTISSLIDRIEFIPEDDLVEHMDKAEEIMKEIDLKDSPFIAVALHSGAEGIWSEDKDFDRQSYVRKFTTKDMFDILLS